MFRTRSVEKEAWQLPQYAVASSWPQWMQDYKTPDGFGVIGPHLDGHLLIVTLEGNMRADPGDWIIKGLRGELYPCKPDIFAATYEPV